MLAQTLLTSGIGAIGAIAAALLLRGQRQIHTLVNSNLDAIKTELQRVTAELAIVTHERDSAQAVTDKVVTAADATAEALRYVDENRPS